LFTGHCSATAALSLQQVPVFQRPFTAVSRVQIPSGTPNLFSHLREFPQNFAVQRRYNLVSGRSCSPPCPEPPACPGSALGCRCPGSCGTCYAGIAPALLLTSSPFALRMEEKVWRKYATSFFW